MHTRAHNYNIIVNKLLCTGTPVPVSVLSLVDPHTPEVELAAAIVIARGIQVDVQVL